MIFINIASYRDPECETTVRDLFRKARHPDQINVGVFLQASPEDDLFFEHPRTRVMRINYHESKGACWARSQAYTLYDGEDYVLQLDSHMRFEHHWDEKILGQLDDCRVSKPILSHYPPMYVPPNVLVGGYDTIMTCPFGFTDQGFLQINPVTINPKPRFPKPAAFLGAAFIFGDARWINEVPYDPHLYFWGEELTLAARLWTHGWDIFAPHEPVVWHRYQRPDPAHWGDHPTWQNSDERSLQRVKHFFRQDTAPDTALVDFDKYGLGALRSLDEYERFAGVNYRQRIIEDRAKSGIFPFPNRPPSVAIKALHLSPPMSMALESSTPLVIGSPDEIDWAALLDKTFGGMESASGPGSSLHQTERLRAALPKAFEQLAIRSLVDAPCGDLNWMRRLDYQFNSYVGVDLDENLIQHVPHIDLPAHYRFRMMNIATEVLPTADALLCRDLLGHLPLSIIQDIIVLWQQAGFTYVFVTTFPNEQVNPDMPLGGWRMLNMQLAPFYWPAPLMMLDDSNDELDPPFNGKALGVWRLSDVGV